jgi:hypothetical protein
VSASVSRMTGEITGQIGARLRDEAQPLAGQRLRAT